MSLLLFYMDNISFLENSSIFIQCQTKEYEDNKKIDENNKISEKILCNHCGRTAGNGIRCLGICVADNEY